MISLRLLINKEKLNGFFPEEKYFFCIKKVTFLAFKNGHDGWQLLGITIGNSQCGCMLYTRQINAKNAKKKIH